MEGEEYMNTGQMDENSLQHWRTKCIKLEKVIKTLSNHCVRVVENHEDLLVKFKKNQDQYAKLKTSFEEKGQQILKARDVLIRVSNESKSMREKYQIAVRCQMEAETFAVSTSTKNKELKRQSQMLLTNLGAANVNIVDIDIDSLEKEDEEEKEYIAKLDQQIDELEEQNSVLSLQAKELTENFQVEKEANEKLREKIELMKTELKQTKLVTIEQEKLLQQVATTSEKVYKEYNDMEQTYKKEIVVRNEAERAASRLFVEREQARRESTMALSHVADNKKLMDAMLEIQDLTAKSIQVKEDYDRRIEALEEQLKVVKEVYSVEGVQAENEELTEESLQLKERLNKTETEFNLLRTQFSELLEKHKDLEIKYEKATHIPPPPPPPPPPPLPTVKSGGFLTKLVGRKGQREKAKEQLKKGGVTMDDNHSKAVDEMMKRIKNGNVGLKPVLQRRTQSLPEQEEASAMTELQGLLSKMKPSRSEDDLSVFGDSGVDEESELGKILRKRQQAIQAQGPPAVQSGVDGRPVPLPRKLSTIQDESEEG